MENGEQSDKAQKRPRDPLEENVLASNELENVLKRRRLVAEGAENQMPVAGSPARSRQVELERKPDTPAITSVRLRVQQLVQRRDGGASLVQRCLSDPGEVCHIGEGEFTLRLERFNAPTPDSSPVLSMPSTRKLSGFVHNVQQQLNTTVTPSTKEASRIRKAREDELKLLKVQPLTDNMWLKRSLSDSSLAEDESNIDSNEAVCSLSFRDMNDTMGEGVSNTSDFAGDFQPCSSDSIIHPKEEISTSALIDKMFEDVLQAADEEDQGEGKENETLHEDSLSKPIKEEKTDLEPAENEPEKSLLSSPEGDGMAKGESPCSSEGFEEEGVLSSEGEKADEREDFSEQERENEEESKPMCNEEDFLTLPPTCVLSPLSKSVESFVTPLRLAATVPTTAVQLPSPQEEMASSVDSAPPLYSIDAYRSQSKTSHVVFQCATPGAQKQAPEKSCIKPTINTKETIKALSEEAARLQTIINQTLQALSCCSDEEHGKGSLQEAEAEKLLLVSSEKHAALLSEISRLREGGKAGVQVDSSSTLQPCRGTVSISSVQLPLKVEFVCSALIGRPTHYFFILIRYGPCNIVATPLATGADAENGDTITFPTSIILQDIRSNFEIDIEVYSLSSSTGNTCPANLQQLRSATKARVTPKKLLSSITKSTPGLSSGALPSLGSRRTSNFSLVGSHKITLASLGQSKFALDKMKFEGKIRRLLGDEFQEKVPFLSPLEGHIYLRLHSESHSNVEHQGFLTMFEDVSGFGAWQRLFFKLEKGFFFYWHHPNEMGSKPPVGSLSLCGFDCVRPVNRDSCARPHTFELVNNKTVQEDNHILNKSWFSADTREERADWMAKLNQMLLDLRTWCQRSPVSEAANTSSNTTTSRESIL